MINADHSQEIDLKVSGKTQDTKTVVDLSKATVPKIADLLAKGLKIKFDWILNPTNGTPVTGRFAFSQLYNILSLSQDFITSLNGLANHDPAVRAQQKSGGDEDPVANGESGEDLAAYIKAILQLDQVSLAEENVPQDPEGNGEPVPIFEAGADGKPVEVKLDE